MGAGKTLIATAAGYIATGRAPAMMSQADDPEGERKRLFAILLEGAAIAMIDNVERAFASDAMCSILTEPVFKDRVLGVSRTASAPTCTTWFITGNNLTIHGDLTTRMLACRIDPECERPGRAGVQGQSARRGAQAPRRAGRGRTDDHSRLHRGRLATARGRRRSAGSSNGRNGAGSR